MSEQNFFELSALQQSQAANGTPYFEFLRVASMSAGVYVLPASGTDRQNPHREDEMYFVVRGRARMQVGAEDKSVAAGSIIFVAKNTVHKFYDIEEELTVIVFFAQGETQS